MEHVSNEIEELGLPPIKNGANFKGALIHLGNELVKNELVSLSKKAGLFSKMLTFFKYLATCSVTYSVYMFITNFTVWFLFFTFYM